MERQGLSAARFEATELRGLAALIGKGMLTAKELPGLVSRMVEDPRQLSALLDQKREAFMRRVGQEHGIPLKDGSSHWSVQEIANLDYVLSELPETFKRIVRNGPPIEREIASSTYTGLYDPFSNKILIPDNINGGGATPFKPFTEVKSGCAGL